MARYIYIHIYISQSVSLFIFLSKFKEVVKVKNTRCLLKKFRKLIFYMKMFSFDWDATLVCALYFMAVAALHYAEDV